MTKIYGVEIHESKDLGYNMRFLRKELATRLGFWGHFERGVQSIAKSMEIRRVPLLIKAFYFILLIPRYITFQFTRKKLAQTIADAQDALIAHYKLPETKVKQFRVECGEERDFYQREIDLINAELIVLNEKYEGPNLGDKTRSEITELIKDYQMNLDQKLRKFSFYKSCEARLAGIEEQIKLRGTLQDSKQKLMLLQDDESDSSRLTAIKKEFELYDYYGGLLEDISMNLKKVSADKSEKMREAELAEMLSRIRISGE